MPISESLWKSKTSVLKQDAPLVVVLCSIGSVCWLSTLFPCAVENLGSEGGTAGFWVLLALAQGPGGQQHHLGVGTFVSLVKKIIRLIPFTKTMNN